MHRLATRSLFSAAAVAATALVLACSSAPPESSASSGEEIVKNACPAGWYQPCYKTGRGIMCSECQPLDDYFTITQLEQTPVPGDNDTSWLDLGPFPYPPELAGTGCSKTAVFHHNADDPGGRIWFCPTDFMDKPSSIAPLPAPPLVQDLVTGMHLTSQALGSPIFLYTALAEDIDAPCPPGDCHIAHGCSGACGGLKP